MKVLGRLVRRQRPRSGAAFVALLAAVAFVHGAPVVAQSASTADAVQPAMTAEEIRSLVGVLAADSLEGREAGTEGADQAARFIAERFAAAGLRPASTSVGDTGAAPDVASRNVTPETASAFLHTFDLPPRVEPGPANRLVVLVEGGGADSTVFDAAAVTPLAISRDGSATGPLVVAPAAGQPPDGSMDGAVALLVAPSDPIGARPRIAELAAAGAVAVVVLGAAPGMPLGGGASVDVPVLGLGFDQAERLSGAASLDLMALVHGRPAPPTRQVTVRATADLRTTDRSTANVVGILPGADPRLSGEAIVLGAHYDHLGHGGAGSLAPGVRAIHNGADDNASGVAGVVELAERFAADPPPRTLVFVAFGAEEEGLLGSQEYARAPVWPLDRTVAMINLDMIGRLRERLTVYGVGTSAEWPAIVHEAAGALAIAEVPDGLGPSDHSTFYGARVPVLAFFTGAHDDYHRPTDDAERIDAEGEVRVLEVAARVIDRLAGDGERIGFVEAPVTQPRPRGFRVALGTIPDYGFTGPGMRLSSVRPGGPADTAGLRAGDVLLSLAGRDIGDVYGYTAILADLEAGREVEVVYERDGERGTARVRPEAR